MHPQLIPNGRRDYFNENYIRNEFEARLKYYFDNFHRLYHDANDAKAAYKKELELRVKQEEFEKKNGVFLNDKERDRMEEEIKTAKKEQEKANKKIERLKEKAKTDPVLQRVLKQVEENHENSLEEIGLSNDGNKKHTKGTNEKSIENNQHRNKKRKSMYLVDELSKLNDKQRKLVSKIYGIISNNLPDKESMALINKIKKKKKR